MTDGQSFSPADSASVDTCNTILAWLHANGGGLWASRIKGAWEDGSLLPAPRSNRVEALDIAPPRMTHAVARGQGFTGNSCTQCGSMRMQVAGHCEVCQECGTTTGCS